MTTVVRWGGSDSRRQSSIYLASDSKFTFDTGPKYGRKTFICKRAPYIFSFCGQAALPLTALPSLVNDLDHRYENSVEINEASIFEFIRGCIKTAQLKYSDLGDCRIIVCGRDGENMTASFYSYVIRYKFHDGSLDKEPSDYSKPINYYLAFGSGKGSADTYNTAWEIKTGSGGFSRAVFSGFFDSICSEVDPLTLPPPQLVGIMASGTPIDFGILWKDGIYQGGALVQDTVLLRGCVDRLFQLIDPATKEIASKAQRHAFYRPLD